MSTMTLESRTAMIDKMTPMAQEPDAFRDMAHAAGEVLTAIGSLDTTTLAWTRAMDPSLTEDAAEAITKAAVASLLAKFTASRLDAAHALNCTILKNTKKAAASA